MVAVRVDHLPILNSDSLVVTHWDHMRKELQLDSREAEDGCDGCPSLLLYLAKQRHEQDLVALDNLRERDATVFKHLLVSLERFSLPYAFVLFQRLLFFSREMGEAEKAEDFFKALEILSETCEFGENAVSVVEKQFFSKVRKGSMCHKEVLSPIFRPSIGKKSSYVRVRQRILPRRKSKRQVLEQLNSAQTESALTVIERDVTMYRNSNTNYQSVSVNISGQSKGCKRRWKSTLHDESGKGCEMKRRKYKHNRKRRAKTVKYVSKNTNEPMIVQDSVMPTEKAVDLRDDSKVSDKPEEDELMPTGCEEIDFELNAMSQEGIEERDNNMDGKILKGSNLHKINVKDFIDKKDDLEYVKPLGQKVCVCELCGARYAHPKEMSRHISKHCSTRCPLRAAQSSMQERKEFHCMECGVRFRSRRPYKNHLKTHTCHCSMCNKTLSCASAYKEHMKTHSGYKPFKCPHCPRSFSRKSDCSLHIKRHDPNRQKMHVCDLCGTSFFRIYELYRHKKIHSGDRPFKCDQCEKAFGDSFSLKNHRLVHTGQKAFICEICGKSFTQKTNLNLHLLRHAGVKDHECSVCGVQFSRKYYLDNHMKSHSGEKPFTCEICGACFSVKWSLQRHQLVHSGERPHQCPFCGKKFTWQSTFKKHVETHESKPEESDGEILEVLANNQQQQHQHAVRAVAAAEVLSAEKQSFMDISLLQGEKFSEQFQLHCPPEVTLVDDPPQEQQPGETLPFQKLTQPQLLQLDTSRVQDQRIFGLVMHIPENLDLSKYEAVVINP